MSDKKPKNPSYLPGELKSKLGGGRQGSSQPGATPVSVKKGGSTGRGFSSPGYREKKKTTAKGHTWQSQRRADRLSSRQFMKKFKGESGKKYKV
jgi:hypothetical protein